MAVVKLYEESQNNQQLSVSHVNQKILDDLENRLEEIKAELTLSAPIMGKTWTPFSPTEAYKQVSMQELVTAIKNMKN